MSNIHFKYATDGTRAPYWTTKAGNNEKIDCLINNYPKEWLAVEATLDAVLA